MYERVKNERKTPDIEANLDLRNMVPTFALTDQIIL